MHRRVRTSAIVVLALALPAFTIFSFDALMRGSASSSSARAGVAAPGYASSAPLGARLFSTGARLRGTGATPAPPSPPPAPEKALPEEVRVPILVYHNVRPPGAKRLSAYEAAYDMTPDQFEAQMRYLKENGYVATSLETVYRALTEGAPLPEKPVVITIDDGRESQYAYAAPVLRKFGQTATYFVFTNAIGRPGYLNREQLLALDEEGNEFCSHSRYHPYLTKSTDDDLVAEVAGSKKALEDALGKDVRCFGYPFGLSDERVIRAVRDAGYAFARGLRHGVAHRRDELFDMRAYIATGDFSQFASIMKNR